jgi:hypothetical protein
VTLQSLVLSIRIMCKDLWKLLQDIFTSILTEWNFESISYKPFLTRREMPRIVIHVSDVSVVTCLKRNGQIFASDVLGVSFVLIDDRGVSRTHLWCVTCLICNGHVYTSNL